MKRTKKFVRFLFVNSIFASKITSLTKITAIIPTFNEAHNIERALASVVFADEVIVIDSFSTDATVELVKKYKDVILLQRAFDDFSTQKNYAISKASYDWIFLLDADEEVTIELKKEVIEKVKSIPSEAGFYIYRNFFFKQKKLNYSGWKNDKVIRLFRKDSNFYQGKVHEKISSEGTIGFLKAKLNHYSYRNYQQYRTKLQHYAKLQATELFEKGSFVTPYHLLLKPFIRLVIQFLLKLGFLDGWRGLVISFAHSYGVFLRYVELLKLKYNKEDVIKEKQVGLRIGYDAKRLFHNATGLGNYSRDLIRILSEFYPDNEYILFNPKPKTIKRFQLKQMMKEVLPRSVYWKKLSSLWRLGPVAKQIEEEKITIFHGLSGEIPFGISSKKTKTIVTVHDLIFERYPKLYSFIDRKIHFYKFKYACKKADKVIAISEQTKQDIINYLGIKESKIEVIYQGCHSAFKQVYSNDVKQDVIQKLNLPSNFILNVGTVEERKNVLSVVKAIKNIDTNLVIVGRKTNYYKKIEAYVKEHNIGSKVFFLEGLSLEELACLYQSAMITVYPSIFEGFGIPIIESLYSRTPVITTRGGVFPEAGGPNSVYVEIDDIEQLGIEIQTLLSSEEKRSEIAKKGWEYAQKFNDENIAKSYMDLYTNL